MAYKGKLIGALLGSFAGPMGSILGGLIGHLYDQAAEDRASLTRAPIAEEPSTLSSSAVSSAQLHFLTSLIGLAIVVASAEGRVRISEIEALKAFFREHFPYPQEDQQLLSNIIDETFLARQHLEVEALCRHFCGFSTVSGRHLLVRLLMKIASADAQGILPCEERLIERIAGHLQISPEDYRSLAAEFILCDGRAYRVLGLPPEASEEQVHDAYRRLAAECHPDRVASLGGEFVRVAEEKFKHSIDP